MEQTYKSITDQYIEEDIRLKEERCMEMDYNHGRGKAKNTIDSRLIPYIKRITHLNVLLETRMLRYKALESEIKMLISEIKKNESAIDNLQKICELEKNKVNIEEYISDDN